jgi:hypothetical protein
VSIRGANLAGVQWVKFGGTIAQFTASSATMVVGVVPKNAHSGKITVHTKGGTGLSTRSFTFVKAAAA